MKPSNHRHRDTLAAILVGLAIAQAGFILISLCVKYGFLEPLEFTAYDMLLRSTASTHVNSPARIALIGETEADLQRHGHPLSDATLTKLLQQVLAADAVAVGVDKYRDLPVAPGTQALHELLAEETRVIWIEKIGGNPGSGIPAPAPLAGGDRVGFSDLLDDDDGIVRRGLLYLHDERGAHRSFALAMADRLLARHGIRPTADPMNPAQLRLGDTPIPPLAPDTGAYRDLDAGGYQFLLDYADARQPIPCYTLGQVLDGELPAGALAGRLVFVGGMATSLGDQFYTPLSHAGGNPAGNACAGAGHRMFGVELHARIAAQLLRHGLDGRPPLRSWPGVAEGLWLWTWATLAGVAALRNRSLAGFLILNLLALGTLLTIATLMMQRQWWIPLVPPAAAWLLSLLLASAWLRIREQRQKALLMRLFSSHVSREVADMLWRERGRFLRDGRPAPQRLTASVLFTDIRGFTSISERLAPEQLMQWLNEYMAAMAAVIEAHGGVIKQYAGDAIMAIFGVPLPRDDEAEIAADARAAVRCALAMNDALAECNRRWEARGLPRVAMRVGIHTGDMVAGSLGSEERMEYAVVGDTVNIAARLESLDREGFRPGEQGDCRIFISAATQRRLDGLATTRPIGTVDLKGRAGAIKVHCVIPDGCRPENGEGE